MRGCSTYKKIARQWFSKSLGGGVSSFCALPKCHYKNFKKSVSVLFAGRAAYAFAFSALIMAMPQLVAAPRELLDISDIDDNIEIDMAYNGNDNFLGRRVTNYKRNNCYLLPATAHALSRANSRLEAQQMRFVVRDCWRPSSASQDMAKWAKEQDSKNLKTHDLTPTQQIIFEDSRLFDSFGYLKTSRLFGLHYLATYSNHNKGSTVDVELLKWSGGSWRKADTGTDFDVFSKKSAMNASVGTEARSNRNAIASVMSSEGFKGLYSEWWHWTHRSSNSGSYLDGKVD